MIPFQDRHYWFEQLESHKLINSRFFIPSLALFKMVLFLASWRSFTLLFETFLISAPCALCLMAHRSKWTRQFRTWLAWTRRVMSSGVACVTVTSWWCGPTIDLPLQSKPLTRGMLCYFSFGELPADRAWEEAQLSTVQLPFFSFFEKATDLQFMCVSLISFRAN